jgi:ABC-type antimicrobial peptide transport system permease subunit
VFRPVTSGYFRAVGTRLLAGRTFSEDEDLFERQRVVIVDDSLARRIAPTGGAVGRTIAFPLDGRAVQAEVVGVVETVRHESLRDPGRATIYVPYRQEASREVSFVLRAAGNTAILTPLVRETVRQLDPDLPTFDHQLLGAAVSRAMGRERLALSLVGGFAVLACVISVLGLYATVAYLVRRRVREFGVRVALGATGGRLIRGVVTEGMRQVGLGFAFGALVATAAAGLIQPLLYETSVLHPLAWVFALTALGAASAAACYLPARTVAAAEPLDALRTE